MCKYPGCKRRRSLIKANSLFFFIFFFISVPFVSPLLAVPSFSRFFSIERSSFSPLFSFPSLFSRLFSSSLHPPSFRFRFYFSPFNVSFLLCFPSPLLSFSPLFSPFVLSFFLLWALCVSLLLSSHVFLTFFLSFLS